MLTYNYDISSSFPWTFKHTIASAHECSLVLQLLDESPISRSVPDVVYHSLLPYLKMALSAELTVFVVILGAGAVVVICYAVHRLFFVKLEAEIDPFSSPSKSQTDYMREVRARNKADGRRELMVAKRDKAMQQGHGQRAW
jgi:hypothetical protein